MTDQNRKTLEDGSIDQAFHARRARGMRSEAAWEMLATFLGRLAGRDGGVEADAAARKVSRAG